MTETRKFRFLLCVGISLLMHGAFASWLIQADLSAKVEWKAVHPIQVSLVTNYEIFSTGKIDGKTEGELDFTSGGISQPTAQKSISDPEVNSVEPNADETTASTIDTDVWAEKLQREPEQPGFNHSEENVDFDSTENAWAESEIQEEIVTETTREVVSVDETVHGEIGQLALPNHSKLNFPKDDLDSIRKVEVIQEEPTQYVLASNSVSFDVNEPQLEQITIIERAESEVAESRSARIEINLENNSDYDALEVAWAQIEYDQLEELDSVVVVEQEIVDGANDQSFETVDAISDADQLAGIAFEPENHRKISEYASTVPESERNLNARTAGDYESELPSLMLLATEQLVQVAWTQIEHDQLEELDSVVVAEQEIVDEANDQSFETVDAISDADQLAGIAVEPENHRKISEYAGTVPESEKNLNARMAGDYESELPSLMLLATEQLVQVASIYPNVVAANKSQSGQSQPTKVSEIVNLAEKKQSNPYQPDVSESNTKATAEIAPLEFAKFDRKTPKEFSEPPPSQVNDLSQEASLHGAAGLGYSAPEFGEIGISNPAPRYPYMSRIREEQGRVVLEVYVDLQGKVSRIQTLRSSGFSRLDRAAVKAVKKWKFVPASQDGTPTSGVVKVPINFVLKN